jgi:stage IV sporulation protein FB
MKMNIKLFDFFGVPVNFNLTILLLFAFLNPQTVIIVLFSILIHELAHAWSAIKTGWSVSEVNVNMIGGYAAIDPNIPSKYAIPIIAAGPISNLVIAGLSFLILGVDNSIGQEVLFINLLLAIFNLLPIFPMDGGRLVREFLLLKMKRNRKLAKQIAAMISFMTSLGLIVFSISQGMWILLIFAAYFAWLAFSDLKDLYIPSR